MNSDLDDSALMEYLFSKLSLEKDHKTAYYRPRFRRPPKDYDTITKNKLLTSLIKDGVSTDYFKAVR